MNTNASSMCEKCYGFLEPDGTCKQCSQSQPENGKKHKKGRSQSNRSSEDQIGLGCCIAVIVFFVIFGISAAAGSKSGTDYLTQFSNKSGTDYLTQFSNFVNLVQSLVTATFGTGLVMLIWVAFRFRRK